MEISSDPATVSMLDQFDAEIREAEHLAPVWRNRKLLRHPITKMVFDRALSGRDVDCKPAPVLRVNLQSGVKDEAGNLVYQVLTHAREATQPAFDETLAIIRCNRCNEPHNQSTTVPFWINGGHVIVQIDLCASCSDHAVFELEGEPQTTVSP